VAFSLLGLIGLRRRERG